MRRTAAKSLGRPRPQTWWGSPFPPWHTTCALVPNHASARDAARTNIRDPSWCHDGCAAGLACLRRRTWGCWARGRLAADRGGRDRGNPPAVRCGSWCPTGTQRASDVVARGESAAAVRALRTVDGPRGFRRNRAWCRRWSPTARLGRPGGVERTGRPVLNGCARRLRPAGCVRCGRNRPAPASRNRSVGDEPEKPIPALLRTWLWAPSQPIAQAGRACSPVRSLTLTPSSPWSPAHHRGLVS